jgi:choline dehydrogenase-like flavoprotein
MTARGHLSAPIGADPGQGGAVDAVVVGSGAGGAPVALTLARAGYRVVVLEKGPAYDVRDFINDEIATTRRDFFLPYTTDEPHVKVDEHGHASKTNEGWTACCVGGGTVHMSGFTYRLHPEDFKLRTLLGEIPGSTLADWPISFEELLPYYERAEVELGISGDARKNPFETFRRPLPLPPLPESGFAALVDEACVKLGLHPYPTARAILSRAFAGRARCQLEFFCASYGCHSGAKSSTLAAIIPRAIATGRCQVRPLSMAHTVETDASGRATGVRYFDAARGGERRIGAAVVVLACSPIETARLLLASRSPAHPDGLANESGLVGRNLILSGFGEGEAQFPRSDPRIAAIDPGQPFVNRSVQDLYLLERDSASPRKGGTLNFLFPHANPIYTAERIATFGSRLVWGKELKDGLRRVGREVRELTFEVFSETLPVADSRVTLDPSQRDRFGLRVARFEVKAHPIDAGVSKVIVDKGIEVLRAMGGQNVRTVHVGDKTPWLMAGTCRFGDDPARSVLDRDCRSRSAPNLFVADGSFMPTSGGVPNTLTVEANSFRVGDRIVTLGKSHDLFAAGGKR